jgi:hypothetical protein
MTNVAVQQNSMVGPGMPYSPLRAEAESAPLLAAAQRTAMDAGASREQACWIAISWAIGELSEYGIGAHTVAAQLEQIGRDLRGSGAKRSL